MEVLYHRKRISDYRRVELIGKKEFAITALDPEHKVFIVDVAALGVDSGDEMHPSRRA